MDFILITFLDFGTDDWFSDQFDDLVFSKIDELTRDHDLVNKKGVCQSLTLFLPKESSPFALS